jgi:integrase
MAKNLEVYESVKRWIKALDLHSRSLDFKLSSTNRAAMYWLREYCNYHKTNPDSLIQDRKATMSSHDDTERRKHEELVQDYAIKLRREGKTPNTISNAVGMIRSFYMHNYVDLKKMSTIRPRVIRRSKTPSPEDLREMVAKAILPIKTWICCQKDTGLASVDLNALTFETLSSEFGSIHNQLKKGIMPIHVEIRRQKTSERTDTFLGENAVDALNEYAIAAARGRIFRISPRSVQQHVKALGIRTKVATKEAPITPYSLRRYFNTRMKVVANVNSEIVELMMGHSIGRVQSAYMSVGSGAVQGIPMSQMAKIYQKAYWALDIYGTGQPPTVANGTTDKGE